LRVQTQEQIHQSFFRWVFVTLEPFFLEFFFFSLKAFYFLNKNKNQKKKNNQEELLFSKSIKIKIKKFFR
jgi:hypothetical protein